MTRGGRYARVQPAQGSLLDEPKQVMTVDEWRKATKRSQKEQLRDKFRSSCKTYGLPTPVEEHLFAKAAMGRRWQFDFCWPQYMVAAEVEGLVVKRVLVAELVDGAKHPISANGRVVNVKECKPQLVTMGRHANADGFREDCVKYNSAALLGWTVLRFEDHQIRGRDAVEATVRMLAARGWTA